MKLIGVHIDHPSGVERAEGAPSKVSLSIDRGLKSGRCDVIPLTEHDLLRLIHDSSRHLMTLRGIR